MNSDDIQEFENQLEQEKLYSSVLNEIPGNEGLRQDPDGTFYEFDPVKKAWFPKIDDDFITNYQYNYGIAPTTPQTDHKTPDPSSSIDPSYWLNPPEDINSEEYRVWYEKYMNYFYSDNSEAMSGDSNGQVVIDEVLSVGDDKASLPNDKAEKLAVKRKPTEEIGWFDIPDEKNTNVFVSGLPSDMSEDSFVDLMKKVGLIAHDPILRKPKIKLYKEETGIFTGTARCCYMKTESVDLALKIIDGSDYNGSIISVERAKFSLKGSYDPSKRKRKLTKQEKKKFQDKQEKLLSWQPEKNEGGRPRYERVVVLKHVFDPKEFEKDPIMMNEISLDIRAECKKFGETKKIIIYDRHEDGVVTVCFKTVEEADLCISALNGRYFGGQQLIATNWDGKTKYLVSETEAEMDARLKQWYSYLEKEEGDVGKVQ